MDNLKKAFEKIKEDINFLNEEILDMKVNINEINLTLKSLINKQNQNNNDSTVRQSTSTIYTPSTHPSTVPLEVKGLKPLNLDISIGNEGASTDRQTDRQTDTSTQNNQENRKISIESNLKEATEILESLDSIKKEIRLKFKHLTPQEMLVFSMIYQLEEQQNQEITYKILSKNLKLSESSVRDYVQRMTNKGIPIKKEKINNKQIFLSISSELKKIASLPTIMRLREL